MPSLTVYLNGAPPAVYKLESPIVKVGREADCEICIDDSHVSSVHATFKRESNGDYRITDLDSSNGTSLNGTPVGNAVLHHGDRITFGVYVRALFQVNVAEAAREMNLPSGLSDPSVSATVARMATQASPSLPMAIPEMPSRSDAEADLAALRKECQLLSSKLTGMRREQQDISAKLREGRGRLAQLSQEIATTEQLNLQSEDEYQRLQNQVERARQDIHNAEELQRVQANTIEENKVLVQHLIHEKKTAELQWEQFQEQALAKLEESQVEAHAAATEQEQKIADLEISYAKRQKELANIIRTIDTKRAEAENALKIKTEADDELKARVATAEDALAGKDREIEKLRQSFEEASKVETTDRLDSEINTRQDSLDYLKVQWDKTKLELGSARQVLETQLAEITQALEARKASAANLDLKIEEKEALLNSEALSAPPHHPGQQDGPADEPLGNIPTPKKRIRIDVPQVSDEKLLARLKEIEATISQRKKSLDDVTSGLEGKTAELREADGKLTATNSQIQQAKNHLLRSQNAAGRYVPPPSPLLPSTGHRLLPRSPVSPFASASPPAAPEEQFLALTVLAPGAGFHSQSFPDGAGTPDLYLHPPIGLHALAACTHGAVKVTLEDEILRGTAPVLLALPGDIDACMTEVQKVLSLNHGRPRIACLTRGIFDRLGPELEKSIHFQALTNLLGKFDGVISTDARTARLVDSLTTVHHHLHLAVPYPIEFSEWEFSIALDKRDHGIFVSGDGFDPDSKAHRGVVDFVNRLAHEHQFPVTVYQHQSGDIPGLNVPDELLTRPDRCLNYNQYISLAASHRFITGFGPNLSGGDIWGDALLCRNLFVGLPSENARKLFAGTVSPVSELDSLATTLNKLAHNSQDYLDHVEKSQWLALEEFSFQTARGRLEEFLETVTPLGTSLPILMAG